MPTTTFTVSIINIQKSVAGGVAAQESITCVGPSSGGARSIQPAGGSTAYHNQVCRAHGLPWLWKVRASCKTRIAVNKRVKVKYWFIFWDSIMQRKLIFINVNFSVVWKGTRIVWKMKFWYGYHKYVCLFGTSEQQNGEQKEDKNSIMKFW